MHVGNHFNVMKIEPNTIMKSRCFQLNLLATLITLCTTAMLAAQPGELTKPETRQDSTPLPDLKAFPPAKAGMERFVIVLPHKERGEEEALKVELMPGKMMETDGVNLYSLGGALVQKNLEGWAYSFYEFAEGPVKMTMMKPGATPVKKFVSGQSLLTHYNSRMPIVIYAPAGCEIRYRIWKADETFTAASKA